VPRGRRLRSPLLVALIALLALEAVGGLVIFVARLASGSTPGESLHVIAGVALAVVYGAYQWSHWTRVRPVRPRLDYALGILGALFMVVTLATGLLLAAPWWRERIVERSSAAVAYAPLLSAAHNIGSMLVLAFIAAHVSAVLARDARARRGD
jgi:hypothetical protein